MRPLPLAVLAASLLAAPPFAPQALAQAAPAQDARAQRPATLSVSGSGEAELKPDFAQIVVAVETEADAVSKAVEANRASSEAVLARLAALGVKKEDIRTENFQVFRTPPRVDNAGKEIKVPNFTANHRLRITTRDLDGVGKLAGEILASPNMLFQSVSFGLDRQDAGGDEARRAAVKDARRQAELYAQAAGVTLGRIREIRDGVAHPFEPRPEMRMMAMAKAANDIPIVPPATLRYQASVQMVWEISPKP